MWHLDFREGILVHDLVFFDHVAFPEKKRGDGVYLVGTQRTFLVERHATVDEVPQHRGVGRVKSGECAGNKLFHPPQYEIVLGRRQATITTIIGSMRRSKKSRPTWRPSLILSLPPFTMPGTIR